MTEDEETIERMKSLAHQSELEKIKRMIELSQVTGAIKVLVYFNTIEGGFKPRLTNEQMLVAAYQFTGVEKKEGENHVPEVCFREPNRLDLIE